MSSQHVWISLIEVNSQDASIPLAVNFQAAPSPWELDAGKQRILNSVLIINNNAQAMYSAHQHFIIYLLFKNIYL